MASTSTGVTSEASTSAEQQYQCKVCDAVYEDKLMLSKHYHSSHKHNNTFLCTKCNYTTEKIHNLKRHTSLHLNDMYYCAICSNHFHTFRELTGHENVHKCTMSNIYPCNICANTFPSFNDLRIHHNISHSSSHSSYTCGVCDAVFENKSILSKHYHSSHKHNNTFLCTKCDYTTKHLSNLKVHTSRHLNDSSSHSFYTCGICDNYLSTIQEFQDHQNVHKCTMSNMFVCSICTNQNFYLFYDLLNHHIQEHLDKVLYICVVCDSVLNTQFFSHHYYDCHRHNRNCVCAKCDFTTTNFKNLEIHAEQMHLYDKSYCMICDKHLYTMHEYNTHRDSHKCTTSNNYRCGICEPIKEFDNFSLLIRHHEMDHLNKSRDVR